jgi:hypothetical protein
MDLWCAECLLMADDEARGWRLLRVDVPGEDGEPQLASFCPICAGKESAYAGSTQTKPAPSRRHPRGQRHEGIGQTAGTPRATH